MSELDDDFDRCEECAGCGKVCQEAGVEFCDDCEGANDERDYYSRTAQDRYDDDCIEQYGCVGLDNDLQY